MSMFCLLLLLFLLLLMVSFSRSFSSYSHWCARKFNYVVTVPPMHNAQLEPNGWIRWMVVYRHKIIEQRYVWHDPSKKKIQNKQSIEDVCWTVACVYVYRKELNSVSLLLLSLLPNSIQPWISLTFSNLAFVWLKNMKINTAY